MLCVTKKILLCYLPVNVLWQENQKGHKKLFPSDIPYHSQLAMSALDYKQLLLEERRKAQAKAKAISSTALATSSNDASSTSMSQTTLYVVDPITWDASKINLGKFSKESGFSLEKYCLDTLPSLYYVPDVIDESTENELLECVEREGLQRNMWQVLKTRKLQLHGEVPSSSQRPGVDTPAPAKELPAWLRYIGDILCDSKIFPSDIYPNNVLINRYEKDQGIMHHTDGPSYASYVVIFSLASDCIMTFKPKLATEDIGVKSDRDVVSVVLKRRSMVIFKDNLYEDYMHGIYPDDVHTVGEYASCANLDTCGYIDGDKVSVLY